MLYVRQTTQTIQSEPYEVTGDKASLAYAQKMLKYNVKETIAN